MATITITYTPAVQFTQDAATEQIFSVWNPALTASDNDAFDGTYYQTNVWDNGEFKLATTLDEFLAKQVAHPGLVAALRAAVRNYATTEGAKSGTYDWEATADDALYVNELAGALESQGFKFAAAGSGSGE